MIPSQNVDKLLMVKLSDRKEEAKYTIKEANGESRTEYGHEVEQMRTGSSAKQLKREGIAFIDGERIDH